MSTVLWANYLCEGRVVSDEVDKYALYKFSKKLDKLTKKLGVFSFLDIQDTTDAEFSVSDKELPDGMESTDELMAKEGYWLEAGDAVAMIEALLNEIRVSDIRFGLFTNARQDVVRELKESLDFAKEAARRAAKFNFSVVM